jgi:hypothetical protein
VNEQLLQQILALLTGQNPNVAGFNPAIAPPSGGLQVPVDMSPSDPTGMSVEPDTLAQNAQNVSPDQLVNNFGSPSGSPAGFPITQAGSNMTTAASPDNFGSNLAQGIGSDQGASSNSDFNFKAAGNAVSSAMNSLASGIAKQGQQGMEQAMRLVSKGGTDPRLRALMQPLQPLGGTTGVGNVNEAALQQLLSMFLPQR